MKNDMPVGYPTFVSFNTWNREWKGDLFGFFRVEVTTPNNLHIPFLGTKIKLEDGSERLIYPKGVFRGVYFSEELNHAISLGYKIRVYGGYVFERGRPFDAFIDHYYHMKKNLYLNSS
uniref:DNA-directed DNA polymerase n=1 Tax=Spizellomyces punctatus TaxID=109760 RepID=Q950Q8_SPIPN|nr:orf117 [Spizellomyces punctatus]AAK84250.1 orf117 [Spizellomyces punctatus]